MLSVFKQGMKCKRERKQHLRKSTVTWWVALWKPLMPTTCYRKRMTLCCKNVILINQKRIIKEKIKILAPTKHTRKFQIQLNIWSTESKVRRFLVLFCYHFVWSEVLWDFYVSARKKLCWWSSNCLVVTSLMLANPPSTLVYKLRDFTIDWPTSMYHGSESS